MTIQVSPWNSLKKTEHLCFAPDLVNSQRQDVLVIFIMAKLHKWIAPDIQEWTSMWKIYNKMQT